MQITFRQGIVASQTLPPYIVLKNGNVAIDVSKSALKVAFSHGFANYLYTESVSINNAWTGPFLSSQNYWLYWNIDLITGLRTFGYTKVNPAFGESFPTSPTIDQHFFNTTEMKMYYFNGQAWVECIRVFAGSIQAGKILTLSLGTQVNVHASCSAGDILFDVLKDPLKRFVDDGTFVFLTSDDVLPPLNFNEASFKINELNVSGKATMNIPKYYGVISQGKDTLGNILIAKASYFNIDSPAFGITIDQLNPGDVRQLITSGFLQDGSWYWDVPPLTPLYIGGDGEISTFTQNAFSNQRIGYVVNLNTIYVSIGQQVLLTVNSPFFVTPTPTVTPTVTPTPTLP
jgi:hypothetical protein